MGLLNFRNALGIVLKTFISIATIIIIFTSLAGMYFLGLLHGYSLANSEMRGQYVGIISDLMAALEKGDGSQPVETPKVTPTPKLTVVAKPSPKKVEWGGPELWQAVNKRRQELGVNPLSSRDELCTIASIRLNELLVLGKLDNHEGFSNLTERRPDLAWIFERYSTMAEFLAVGGQTAEETVSLWENTLGHKKLLTGGEYVWGCIYAQNTFAVAITAF